MGIVFLFQTLGRIRGKRGSGKMKLAVKALLTVALCLGLSLVVTYLKTGRVKLPDAGIPHGMNIAVEETLRLEEYTRWNSLHKYGLNIITPFTKLLDKLADVKMPEIIDTPVHIAFLVDGVPKREKKYYHYPTLVYADAYVSFGRWGVVLGLFWGGIITLAECLLRRNAMALAIALPFYTWHLYMVIRGATAIASSPLSYAPYIQMICVYLVVLLHMFMKKGAVVPARRSVNPGLSRLHLKRRRL
jgi:hypothetical protein